MIYLDYNATTAPSEPVAKLMEQLYATQWFNPSSAYTPAKQVAQGIEQAREQIAALLGVANPLELVFTSSATEASCSCFHSVLHAYQQRGVLKPVMMCLASDHSATLSTLQLLAQSGSIELRICKVLSNGQPDMQHFSELLDGCQLLTFALVNNESGALMDGATLCRLAKQAGSLVHVDAVQAAGKIPLDLQADDYDFASISLHKLHGPKGVGVLYYKSSLPYKALISGGSQEQNRRGGTYNSVAILAAGLAASLAKQRLDEQPAGLAHLQQHFESKLQALLPHITINAAQAARNWQTSSITFHEVRAEALLLMLDNYQIYASAGSACQSGNNKPSHVLSAMGLTTRQAQSTVRFSYGWDTSLQQLDEAIERIVACYRELAAAQSGKIGPVVIYRPKSSL